MDEPRRAVEGADKLVAAVMQRLAEGFANERSNLEKQWDRGENGSTEDGGAHSAIVPFLTDF